MLQYGFVRKVRVTFLCIKIHIFGQERSPIQLLIPAFGPDVYCTIPRYFSGIARLTV